ncbi:hypothetical protein [Nocardioides acrostichi]|uniref:Uncharacterized protein n=1 Tax=Nocardioides acrostichi TaxID=2784339 RepID=A0A930Y635_9ACTN|nr:hypothetical protein [Nocardioides acrostichi]MBF4160537.1 hypothetical protein [Nocardioides acrostichi]
MRLLHPLVILAALPLTGCGSDVGVSAGGDCLSTYDGVVSAESWPALKQSLLDSDHFGRVAGVRTQARGDDVESRGDQDAVRVVDLLNRRDRRLAQLEVWRTDDGGWSAGQWGQCTD